LVTPKDKNPQDQPSVPVAPASNPPKLGPALPETYVFPQQAELQQMAVTSATPSAKNAYILVLNVLFALKLNIAY